MNQLELDAVPRKRVQLIADEPAAVEGGAGSGDGLACLVHLVARKANTAMAHAMKRAVSTVGSKAVKRVVAESEGPALSDWAEGAPPMTGWWDVKLGGKLGKFEDDRLWFSAEHQQWRTEGGIAIDALNLKGMVYRGLAAPAPEGYSWLKPSTRRVVLVA